MIRRNIIFKTFRFIFSFIVTFMLVTCQIMPCFVYAEALPDPSLVEVPLWTVIEGGADPVVEQTVKAPFIFSSEIDSLFALNAVAKEHYWNETKATINQKISDGTLSASDIGTVLYYEIDGERVPVGIKHSLLYGDSMFFLTDDLAYKIQSENIQNEQAILNAITDYWERVVVSDVQPFKDAAADLNNWVTSVNSSFSVNAKNILNEIMFNAFGEPLSTPNDDFYTTGLYATYDWGTTTIRRYNLNFSPSLISQYNDFFIVRLTRFENNAHEPREWINLYAHSVSETNPSLYIRVAGDNFGSDAFKGLFPNGFRTVTFSTVKAHELGFGVNYFPPLDMRQIFSNWDLIVSLPDVDPSIQPGIRYNVGAIEGSVEDIAELAQEAIDANSDSQGNPEYNPGDYPVINPDALPDVLPDPYPSPLPVQFPQDFPDPDSWIEVDSNPFPDPVPDPGGDGPGGDDGGDDGPGGDDGGDGNGWDDEPPSRPQLRIPVLLTLFPFCIPFDIKRSIEWFGDSGNSSGSSNNSVSEEYNTGVYNNMSASEAEEINGNGMEPVFAIPLNIGVSGRPVLQSTVVLDLTEYGIPVLVQYLKTVQIIAWIIVLGVATYKFIY